MSDKDIIYGPLNQHSAKEMMDLPSNPDIPDTLEIVSYLDDYIVGQDTVKKALAVAAVRHMHVIGFNEALERTDMLSYYLPEIYTMLRKDVHSYKHPLKKQNIMIIGPSGSGKTLTISKLADFMGVPYHIADATSLTAAGYVGESVDTVLTGLLDASKNQEEAERGIVFIDEIDKVCASNDGDRRDVGGLEVQHALLKLIEGGTVNIGNNQDNKTRPFNTDNVLFILGGAFTSLRENLNRKAQKVAIGFVKEKKKKHYKITIKDLLGSGMSTEFIGRISTIVETKQLTKAQLKAILTEPKDAILKQYKVIFELMGKKWDHKGEAALIRRVINKAIKTKTGARGLATVLEEELREALYD